METLDSIEKVLNSTSKSAIVNPEWSWKSWGWRMLKRTVIFVLFIKCIKYLNQQKWMDTLFNSFGDRASKFDLKMAKDIDQRLSDIKGIDEISEEV